MAQVQFKYISTYTKENGKVDFFAVPDPNGGYTGQSGMKFAYGWADLTPNTDTITLDDVTDEKAVLFIRQAVDWDGLYSFEEI